MEHYASVHPADNGHSDTASIGTIMKGDFQMFWQVTGNNPMTLEVTDVIDTYVTRSLDVFAGIRYDKRGRPVSVRIFLYP